MPAAVVQTSPRLSAEQREQFVSEGYVVVSGLIPAGRRRGHEAAAAGSPVR